LNVKNTPAPINKNNIGRNFLLIINLIVLDIRKNKSN